MIPDWSPAAAAERERSGVRGSSTIGLDSHGYQRYLSAACRQSARVLIHGTYSRGTLGRDSNAGREEAMSLSVVATK